MDHAEAIVAIVHVGEQQQEIAGGLLGLVELAGSAAALDAMASSSSSASSAPERLAAMAAFTSRRCKRYVAETAWLRKLLR
jgi:hypothetical protein